MEIIPRAKRGLHEPSSDMISDLPRNVIDHIARFLPIMDAARMSVLSKKWRSIWLSLPRLVFYDEFSGPVYSRSDAFKWSNIISNILLLHEGPIIEFFLTIPDLPPSSHIDIIPWLSFVLRNGVKSLEIYSINFGHPWRLPSCFFSSPGLKNLTLDLCIIGRLSFFTGLRNLLSLNLFDVVFEADILEEFFAACPVLEKLTLSMCTTHDPIIINLPNLKVLNVDGIFRCIIFKSASSLVSLHWGLQNEDTIEWADMMNSLANLGRLRRLSLYGYACKSLANYGVSRVLPTTFKHVKIFNLSWIAMNHMKEFMCAFGAIQSCPYVEELILSMRVHTPNANGQELNILGSDETKNVDDEYTFNHLRSIHLVNVRGLALEMKLISYLLASSPSLERLSFTFHNTVEAREELKLHREMLQFRRASPRAQVKQIEYSNVYPI